MKNFHDAIQTEVSGLDPTLRLAPDIESCEMGYLDQPIALNQRSTEDFLALNEDINQVTDNRAIQELEAVDWAPLITGPDQSWWFDSDFEPNSLDMSLFEPFPLQNDPQGCSQLSPPDPTLPRSEIEKAWFTYIDDTMTSETLQGSSPARSTSARNHDTYELDEDFRMRACQRLSTHLNTDHLPLPSIGLLVSSPN